LFTVLVFYWFGEKGSSFATAASSIAKSKPNARNSPHTKARRQSSKPRRMGIKIVFMVSESEHAEPVAVDLASHERPDVVPQLVGVD
jgi:hypothetical protein